MPGFQATGVGVIKMKVSLQHECNQVSVGQFDDEHKEVVVSAQTGAFLYGSEIMDSTEELFIKIDGKSARALLYSDLKTKKKRSSWLFVTAMLVLTEVDKNRNRSTLRGAFLLTVYRPLLECAY